MDATRRMLQASGCALLLGLAGCALPPASPAALQVTGTATYRERIALPPGAVFEARIEDVARADAASTPIGSLRIDSPSVPVRFAIPVDAARLSPQGRYSVRARITLGERLLFTSTAMHPVLVNGAPSEVQIVMQRVPAATDTPPEAPAPARRLSGQYRYMADAAVFVDCASGERLAVAEAGDNLALQRAYGAARPAPGASMLVTVDGRVQAAPGGALRSLVVDRFIAITAGPCGTGQSQAQLQNTYWKLTVLRGQPVSVAAGQREPHLVLQVKPERLAGFGGCNRLMGGYQVNGDQLRFTGIAATRMACAPGGSTEQAFLDALAQVLRWRIDAEMLELFDAQGQSLARFESRYL